MKGVTYGADLPTESPAQARQLRPWPSDVDCCAGRWRTARHPRPRPRRAAEVMGLDERRRRGGGQACPWADPELFNGLGGDGAWRPRARRGLLARRPEVIADGADRRWGPRRSLARLVEHMYRQHPVGGSRSGVFILNRPAAGWFPLAAASSKPPAVEPPGVRPLLPPRPTPSCSAAPATPARLPGAPREPPATGRSPRQRLEKMR